VSKTLAELVKTHGVEIDPHLERELSIPVLAGMQRQGDVLVSPAKAGTTPAKTPVAKAGFPVVRGENGGNTHLLLAEGDVWFDVREATVDNLALGTLTIADDAIGHLAHPEHGYMSMAPGTYTISRQREQSEVTRMVAD
jgi:hypothetical protein